MFSPQQLTRLVLPCCREAGRSRLLAGAPTALLNMVLMSRFVHDAMRMVRAASSGDELDVSSAKLAGTDVAIFFFS